MNELLQCPFCGGEAEITKHFKHEMWSLLHRCDVMGPMSLDWDEDWGRLVSRWNTRKLASKDTE